MRFLAALIVVMVHARAFSLNSFGALEESSRHAGSAAFYILTRIGTQGVLIFFVLSGFLVGGRSLERAMKGTFSAADYAIDRISRILVPFLPALIFTAIVAAFIHDERPAGIAVFLGNLFFLQGIAVPPYPCNDPLWSLSYEVWFYMMAVPVCLAILSQRLRATAFLALAVGFCVFIFLKPVYLFCWLMGAAAYFVRPKRFSLPLTTLALLICAYGMGAVQIFSAAQTSEVNEMLSRGAPLFVSMDFGIIVFSIGIAFLTTQILKLKPNFPILSRIERLGTPLAAFSYTLYLLHNPVLFLFAWFGLQRSKRFDGPFFLTFAGIVITCLIVSYLFYLAFERQTPAARRWMRSIWGKQVRP